MAGSIRGRVAAVVLVPAMLLLAGCPGPSRFTATSVDPGFGTSDVDHLEVYSYRFAAAPEQVGLTVVTDRRAITTWVEFLTDLPASPADPVAAQLAGAKAAGFRFQLRDGTSYEVTHLFLGGQGNVLIWPDGTVVTTDYGSPIGYAGAPVNPDQRPRAVIP